MAKIFVGNLSHSATELEVRALFARYGRVSSVQIKTDIATNRPRGFAFVTMPSMDDADEAIAHLSQTVMHGRSLTVNEAQTRADEGQREGSMNAARRNALALFGALQSD
ncbi:MAG: RNA recognition motif domain-containing protein [Planctomycetota bacterium]|jgi:RNA recognition motif-containing protein